MPREGYRGSRLSHIKILAHNMCGRCHAICLASWFPGATSLWYVERSSFPLNEHRTWHHGPTRKNQYVPRAHELRTSRMVHHTRPHHTTTRSMAHCPMYLLLCTGLCTMINPFVLVGVCVYVRAHIVLAQRYTPIRFPLC